MLMILSLKAQQNSSFTDSILRLVISNQIPVFNTEFKRLDNQKVVLVIFDTVINDQWTRPKYIDNIFHKSFDGVAIAREIIFDTAMNKTDSRYLEFNTAEYNLNGDFIGNRTVFLIRQPIQPQIPKSIVPSALITSNGRFWQNSEIQILDEIIPLDSCHARYRLEFNKEYMFKQYYNINANECHTDEMEHKIEVGVEGDVDEFFEYNNKLQGHYIDNPTGFWRIENGNLILTSIESKKIITYKIINLTDEEIFLGLEDNKFKVKLKKSVANYKD